MGLSVLALALAWRWELICGVMNLVFFMLQLALYWAFRCHISPLTGLLIFYPVLINAILFMTSVAAHKVIISLQALGSDSGFMIEDH